MKSQKFLQNGGTWKHSIKRGIRKASDQYRYKQRWYHMGPIASAGNFFATKINNKLMSQLADAIDIRCKKMNIYLSEVSSDDFEKLTFYTRLIFLKQDLKQKTTYDELLSNIEKGKLDTDFAKYYEAFKYTKHSKPDPDGLFRKSIPKEIRKAYSKHRDEKDLFEDIEKEHLDKYTHVNKRTSKRKSSKRKSSKRKTIRK